MAKPAGELIVGRSVKKCQAICRLICFHWAGGGTPHYIRWAADFSDDLEGDSIKHLPYFLLEKSINFIY